MYKLRKVNEQLVLVWCHYTQKNVTLILSHFFALHTATFRRVSYWCTCVQESVYLTLINVWSHNFTILLLIEFNFS